MLLLAPTDVHKLWITFRTQKNGDNGERRLFTCNPRPDGHCMVATMYRIFRRFTRLCGAWNTSTPLAVYHSSAFGSIRMITARAIERHMREVASVVYSFNTKAHKTDIQRWSSHSLRVGACVLLHSQNFSASQIKFLLRWRSDAFMVYLRNVVPLSDQHNEAWDTAKAMPNFL